MFFSPDPFVQALDNWLNYNRYGYAYGNPFKSTDPSGEFFFSLIIPGFGTLIDAACWGAFGGDFTQGFASGALGSLGGSAFQTVGGKFANSFLGTVGFSAISGGIGAELSGGDFWRGAATGATIGFLNHMEGKVENKKSEIIMKKSHTIINQPNVELEGFLTISNGGNSNVATVVDANTGLPVEIQTSSFTYGVDGTITTGSNILKIGTDGRNYIFDVSIPTGRNTGAGFSLKLNSQKVNSLMYYVVPLVFRVPYRIPAYR
ncbi:hypothetical protein SDC9_100988 [bioreactor metagenome]|uniref:Uncharacterized protein n=1 Tax=bioreactor metagenome TaxID=1076179 RepID=A0A645AXE8_9ZZZZ